MLIISAVFPPEPVVSANLSYDIACSLSERNPVTVISPEPSRPMGFKFSGESMHTNFKHIQATSFVHADSGIVGRFKESYSFGKCCYKYISDNHKDLDTVYANTWPLLAQYYAVKAAIKYNVPIIIHVQDIYPESLAKKFPFAKSLLNAILVPLDKYILARADKVIVVSQKMKEYLVKSRNLNRDKISVIPNWQDEESFLNYQEKQDDISEDRFTFMYMGNIGPVAGVNLLLEAFAKAQLKKARLVIAGSGSMKQSLEKQAQNYSDCIIEFWDVPQGKVPEVQSRADVLILPIKKGNASTSIPSKLPAYMFSARPIIACIDADSETAAAINDANCGWVVEPENRDSLACIMQQVFGLNGTKLQKLGMNGKEYALLNLSKKANLQKVVSVIENLVTWK